jgi:hypothetical protein
MSTARVTYDQPIDAHYDTIITRYLERTNEKPPSGCKMVELELPPDAIRIDTRADENKFMEELLELIRERCTADLKAPLRIDANSSEVVNRHLRGCKLKAYPGTWNLSQAWIQVKLNGGAIKKGIAFNS